MIHSTHEGACSRTISVLPPGATRARKPHAPRAATRLLRPRRLMPESQRSGGARGGKDQFSWDSVRQDKECDNYLGASIHASRGRWQKGKDLGWYAKGRKDENIAALAEEKRLVKEQEEDMIMDKMGNFVRAEASPLSATVFGGASKETENDEMES